MTWDEMRAHRDGLALAAAIAIDPMDAIFDATVTTGTCEQCGNQTEVADFVIAPHKGKEYADRDGRREYTRRTCEFCTEVAIRTGRPEQADELLSFFKTFIWSRKQNGTVTQ